LFRSGRDRGGDRRPDRGAGERNGTSPALRHARTGMRRDDAHVRGADVRGGTPAQAPAGGRPTAAAGGGLGPYNGPWEPEGRRKPEPASLLLTRAGFPL